MKCEWKGGAGTESWETLAFQGGGGPERLEGLRDGHAPICSFILQPFGTPTLCQALFWALGTQ